MSGVAKRCTQTRQKAKLEVEFHNEGLPQPLSILTTPKKHHCRNAKGGQNKNFKKQ